MVKSGNGMKRSEMIGVWFFSLGIGVAVIGGILYPNAGKSLALNSALIALGSVVGLLNVTNKETTPFLMAAVSLVIISALGGSVLSRVDVIGKYLESVLLSILAFVIPSATIVALKSIYSLEKNK